MVTCSLYNIVVCTTQRPLVNAPFPGMSSRRSRLTFPAESNPSMSIRTSLSLLQLRRDDKELTSDETERPIQE
jgi:hypothetical protein